MKINWKVRFKNPIFWVNVFGAIVAPILAHLGVNWEQITTWEAFGDLFVQAIGNPVICVSVMWSIWNAVNDPTTVGIKDSDRALTYNEPRE